MGPAMAVSIAQGDEFHNRAAQSQRTEAAGQGNEGGHRMADSVIRLAPSRSLRARQAEMPGTMQAVRIIRLKGRL